jgi:hypothetical protein
MTNSGASEMPTWLSIAVAVATILAAYFAARSAHHAGTQASAAKVAVKEAQQQGALNKAQLIELKRQSDISLHAHRLDIYKAFLDFRFELKARSHGFNREKLWSYWAQARLAEFYFDLGISTALGTTVDQGIELQSLGDQIADPQGAPQEEIMSWREESYRIRTELDQAFDALDSDLRNALRLLPA